MHQVCVQASGQRDGCHRSSRLLAFGDHLRLQLRAVSAPRRSWLGCHNVHFKIEMDIISESFRVSRWDRRALTTHVDQSRLFVNVDSRAAEPSPAARVGSRRDVRFECGAAQIGAALPQANRPPSAAQFCCNPVRSRADAGDARASPDLPTWLSTVSVDNSTLECGQASNGKVDRACVSSSAHAINP